MFLVDIDVLTIDLKKIPAGNAKNDENVAQLLLQMQQLSQGFFYAFTRYFLSRITPGLIANYRIKRKMEGNRKKGHKINNDVSYPKIFIREGYDFRV